MATAATYTKSGNPASKNTALPVEIFQADKPSAALVHQAYTTLQANQRNGGAKTKTRSMVRGGGRKPWRQKGTGYARAGSNNSPLWRSGGVTFGPTGAENHSRRLTKNMKRTALIHALTFQNQDGQIAVIENIEPDGTVASFMKIYKTLPFAGKLLIVADTATDSLSRSTRNVANVAVTTGYNLHVRDVMDADWVMFTKPGLKSLQARLGSQA